MLVQCPCAFIYNSRIHSQQEWGTLSHFSKPTGWMYYILFLKASRVLKNRQRQEGMIERLQTHTSGFKSPQTTNFDHQQVLSVSEPLQVICLRASQGFFPLSWWLNEITDRLGSGWGRLGAQWVLTPSASPLSFWDPLLPRSPASDHSVQTSQEGPSGTWAGVQVRLQSQLSTAEAFLSSEALSHSSLSLL